MADAARRAGARVVTYSARTSGDLCASQVRTDLRGTQLFLNGMGISRTLVWLPLAGRYNVENALAAAAGALVSGASPSIVLEGLATVPSAPGRLEPVATNGRGFTLLVDYAHSEAALANVCSVLRATLDAQKDDAVASVERTQARAAASMSVGGSTSCAAIASEPTMQRRLIVVFGCGGDRDKGKRAPMGRVVNELADLAIVTSDNPRTEDPEAILDDIEKGMTRTNHERIEDRRAAIARALAIATANDVVVLAGKGHEDYQIRGTEKLPFDEKAIVGELSRAEAPT
jgi:UDP-N-acetylmuramoyl-L-alanyl-D-glutamate--2,6-diaminopimelate ligase